MSSTPSSLRMPLMNSQPFIQGRPRDVERDRVRTIAPRQIDPALAAHRNHTFQSFDLRHVQQDAGKDHVAPDYEHHAITVADRFAIVGRLLLDDELRLLDAAL